MIPLKYRAWVITWKVISHLISLTLFSKSSSIAVLGLVTGDSIGCLFLTELKPFCGSGLAPRRRVSERPPALLEAQLPLTSCASLP